MLANAPASRSSSWQNSPAAYLVISHFPDGAGEGDLFADGGGHVADRLRETRHICEQRRRERLPVTFLSYSLVILKFLLARTRDPVC